MIWVSFVVHQVLSWRRADGVRRQQLKWLASGAAVALAVGVGGSAVTSGVASYLLAAALIALPVSIGVAILRYRLYEIDRIISRTLSYAIVTGLLVGVYAGLVLLTTHLLAFSSSASVAAVHAGGGGPVQPAAAAGAAPGGPAVQPGPVRRGPTWPRSRRG